MRCLLLLFAFWVPLGAQAGRACEEKPSDAQRIEKAMNLALNTARALDASGAKVAVVARVGQDLSKYGLRYSHLGLAYLVEPAVAGSTIPGVWRVAHKLNHCGSAQASVYRQGLAEFFLDDLQAYEAGVVMLNQETQTQVLDVLQDNQRLLQMHTPEYNMLAYPWSLRYQQSNQWALETLAMALDKSVVTRQQAQAWLMLKAYVPTTLTIGALKRLGARVGAANIAFDDHPNDKRFSDRIETVTVDSVFQWLHRSCLATQALTIR
jgi:hypothetical protein